MVGAEKFLYPMLFRKTCEAAFVGNEEEREEVCVFADRSAMTAKVDADLTFAVLVESDEVRIWIMSVEERIHP